jgi:hypothetical protein
MSDSGFNTCELTAERIHSWLGRDIFYSLIQQLTSYDLFQSRRCDLVKIPRIPSQIEYLSLYGYEISHEKKGERKLRSIKKQTVNLEALQKEVSSGFSQVALHTHCCVNQKNPYLMQEFASASHFTSKRMVKSWQLKEHFLAFRRFKSLAKERSEDPKQHQITSLRPSKQSTVKPEDHEYWAELMRSKDHRLFQIDRVTKFLSD